MSLLRHSRRRRREIEPPGRSQAPTSAAEPLSSVPRVAARLVDDVLVLTPCSAIDRSLLGALDRLLAGDPVPAVLDLSDSVIVDREVVAALDPARWGRDVTTMCVVCRRFSGRQLLALYGASARLPVVQRLDDACDALAGPATVG